MKKLSRREFLKGTAAGAVSLSALSLLSACSDNEPQAQGNSIKWDKEADVVVVGTGTVITAAIAAAEQNAKVVILEKDATFFGGTSVTSGGGYALPGFLSDFADENNGDNRADCLAYMMAVGEGRMTEAPMTSFVDNVEEFCTWLKGVFGWSKFAHNSVAPNDYYEKYVCGGAPGRGSAWPLAADGTQLSASDQWQAFREYLEAKENVTLMMGTPAEELITDENGKVIGVYASSEGQRIAIKASKAVILGTGGFDHNENMRKQYLPVPFLRSVASRNNTGDSQRMGAKIGAQLALMDRYFGLPHSFNSAEWKDEYMFDYSVMEQAPANADYTMFLNLPFSVCVNRKGKRFTNEGRAYDTFNRAFSAYDTGDMTYENIPAFFICDSRYTERYMLPGYCTAAGLHDYVFKFDTLEELADGMGIDKEGLLREMAWFNENAKKGVDPDWHRGESAYSYDTFLSRASVLTLPGADNSDINSEAALLQPVEQGPFYCVRYVPGSMNTRGGLQVDGDSQVLNQDGEKIPGLYAVGTCSTGVAGYWAGGACISQGCVMGYVAAKSALNA